MQGFSARSGAGLTASRHEPRARPCPDSTVGVFLLGNTERTFPAGLGADINFAEKMSAIAQLSYHYVKHPY
jgi:hypothetical protein